MSDAEDVLAAARARADTLAAGDAEALSELLHQDFVWTSHLGQRLDRSAYVGRNTGGTTVWLSQTLVDPTVTVVDDTAVLLAEVVDIVAAAGGPQEHRMPMTQVWVRTNDGWRCLAGHAGPRV